MWRRKAKQKQQERDDLLERSVIALESIELRLRQSLDYPRDVRVIEQRSWR